MSIGSVIKSTVISGLVKGTGAAAIGLSAYDAHVYGKHQAKQNTQQCEADRVTDSFQNTMYQESPSAVMSGVKKKIFNFQMENNFMQPVDATIGYLKGFASMAFTNIIPLIMGGLALFGRGKAIPRTSALGLVLYGGYNVLREGFGLGRPNRLNPPFKD